MEMMGHPNMVIDEDELKKLALEKSEEERERGGMKRGRIWLRWKGQGQTEGQVGRGETRNTKP